MRYKLDVTVSFRFLKSVAFYLVLWYNSLKIFDFEPLEELLSGQCPSSCYAGTQFFGFVR